MCLCIDIAASLKIFTIYICIVADLLEVVTLRPIILSSDYFSTSKQGRPDEYEAVISNT